MVGLVSTRLELALLGLLAHLALVVAVVATVVGASLPRRNIEG
jgi:hypothetical protein